MVTSFTLCEDWVVVSRSIWREGWGDGVCSESDSWDWSHFLALKLHWSQVRVVWKWHFVRCVSVTMVTNHGWPLYYYCKVNLICAWINYNLMSVSDQLIFGVFCGSFAVFQVVFSHCSGKLFWWLLLPQTICISLYFALQTYLVCPASAQPVVVCLAWIRGPDNHWLHAGLLTRCL